LLGGRLRDIWNFREERPKRTSKGATATSESDHESQIWCVDKMGFRPVWPLGDLVQIIGKTLGEFLLRMFSIQA